MSKQILTSLCALGLFICVSEGTASAASLADCGNIDVNANATCNVMAEGGCTAADCQPLACSATLYADCKGNCQVPDVTCEGSCQGTCETNCTAKGSIDCRADCQGRCGVDCSGKCTTQCASDANKSTCEANCKGTCKASCQGECNAKCEVVPPSATCQAQCQGSCKGSCTATGNLGCQMTCRTKGEASCTGGCEVACTQPRGAIFCDGQFIDAGNNAQSCITALTDVIKATVNLDATASGSASCSNGSCEAQGEAKASASCAMAPAYSDRGSWFGFGLLGVVTAGLVRRRLVKSA